MRYRDHYGVAEAVHYVEKTSLCPICRKRKSAYGITCGDTECISLWLRGQADPCIGLIDYGIQKHKSDLIAHVCFVAKHIYSFSPSNAVIAIRTGKYRKVAVYQFVGTQKVRTSGGYLVPPDKLNGCVWARIPQDILIAHSIRNSMTTSNKGMAAQNVIIDSIKNRTFPFPDSMFVIDEVCDENIQVKGIDLVIVPTIGKIESKCDLRGGHKEFGGTGNLFLQTCEINPLKLY